MLRLMRWKIGVVLFVLPALVHAEDAVTVELEWEPGAKGSIFPGSYPLTSERPPDIKIPTGVSKPRFCVFPLLGVDVPVLVDSAG